jgi:hypothetical protein
MWWGVRYAVCGILCGVMRYMKCALCTVHYSMYTSIALSYAVYQYHTIVTQSITYYMDIMSLLSSVFICLLFFRTYGWFKDIKWVKSGFNT